MYIIIVPCAIRTQCRIPFYFSKGKNIRLVEMKEVWVCVLAAPTVELVVAVALL